jgi:hypothetical protein
MSPALDDKTVKTHDEACSKGQEWYLDPYSGLLVFTRLKLLKNGECCGSGCRHCPYNPKAKAGNRTLA